MQLRWWNPLSWLIAIWREIRALFPWTQNGRRTSLYIAVLGAGPVLTLLNWDNMRQARALERWSLFDLLAQTNAASLFVVVLAIAVGTGLNIFVKAGKDGVTGSAGGEQDVVDAARDVADAADAKASEIEEAKAPELPAAPEYERFEEEQAR